MNRDIRLSEFQFVGDRAEALQQATNLLQQLEGEQNRRVISASVDWAPGPRRGGVLNVFVTHCDVLDG